MRLPCNAHGGESRNVYQMPRSPKIIKTENDKNWAFNEGEMVCRRCFREITGVQPVEAQRFIFLHKATKRYPIATLIPVGKTDRDGFVVLTPKKVKRA